MQVKYEKYYRDFEKHCNKVLKSTTVDIHESVRNKAHRVKELEADYISWFEYYFPHYAKSKSSWYHKKVAKLLTEKNEVYLIQRIFRSGAKSVHANMGVPLYLYYAKKDLGFMLLIGENADKAKKLLSDLQAELKHNKRLENDYGKRFKYGDWADGNFSTSDDTHFYSLGIGQSPRGVRDMEKRPDYISVDDVDTKKKSKNPKLTNELFQWLKEDLMGTFGSGKRRYVQSNNRFSKVSTIQLISEHFNKVREEYKQKGKKTKHHIIIAKAIMDNGKSGWEENYSLDYWNELRIDIGELAFQREYQDNPIEEGTVFKNEWIQYKQRLQLHQYDALMVYGDLSYSDIGDYKALLLVGRKDKEFHVLKSFVRKTTRANVASWLYDLYESWNLKKYNIKYKIEGNFAQGDIFIPDFDDEGKKRGYYIPVTPDKKAKANKVERIESMSPFFERGNVFFNAVEKETSDMINLVEQILAFEKGSKVNDDGPDCLQSAIDELNHMHFDIGKIRMKSRKEKIKERKNRF
ncbi:MAG: hypothetical protein JXR60_12220 [Bacteroidales bacterium]|nr:hypothetical protein [Bacteroidales bacterium]